MAEAENETRHSAIGDRNGDTEYADLPVGAHSEITRPLCDGKSLVPL
jgi:hypothetical protein